MTTANEGSRPLEGRAVLVTRPARDASKLMRAVEAAGGVPICQPGIEVLPTASPEGRALVSAIGTGEAIVLTSRNALERALELRPLESWPDDLTVFAVGETTKAAAEQAGFVNVRAPTVGTGAMALLPQLRDLDPPPKRVVMLAAPGGQTDLLKALDAETIPSALAFIYERRPAARVPGVAAAIRKHAATLIVIASSSAILDAVTSLFPDLTTCPLVVPSDRVALRARALGYERTRVAAGPDDDALLAAAIASARE